VELLEAIAKLKTMLLEAAPTFYRYVMDEFYKIGLRDEFSDLTKWKQDDHAITLDEIDDALNEFAVSQGAQPTFNNAPVGLLPPEYHLVYSIFPLGKKKGNLFYFTDVGRGLLDFDNGALFRPMIRPSAVAGSAPRRPSTAGKQFALNVREAFKTHKLD
jgi:hypothetical protein